MKNYTKYTVEELATDPEFISWILSPNEKSTRYWNSLIAADQTFSANANEAAALIRSLLAVEPEISEKTYYSIWEKIEKNRSKSKSRSFMPYFRWAAVFILLVTTTFLIINYSREPKFSIEGIDVAKVEEARIILQDGSVQNIDAEKSEIAVQSSGEIIVNNDTLKVANKSTHKEELVQVIMPYGKQSSIYLPDGSKVYINAGSIISFPSTFSGSKREVQLIGEAFFEVKKNPAQPFIVHTPEIRITVTGTSFNVSAYADDSFARTVLVEGSVSVGKKAKSGKDISIKPGESAFFDKADELITTGRVDTEKYTSWINNYVICKNDPLAEVVKKIERYYNQPITVDKGLYGITFSGKLDLKDDISKVLASIAYASEMKITTSEGKINIEAN